MTFACKLTVLTIEPESRSPVVETIMGNLSSIRYGLALATVAASLAFASQAQALVYNTSAAGELTGSRSLGDPGILLTTSGMGSAPTSFSIS
jgi:hypothetical protein